MMNKARIATLFLCPLLLAGATAGYAAQATPLEEDLPIQIKLRVDDQDPVTLERMMAPGTMDTIDMAGGYRLELSVPENDLDMGVAHFVRRDGENEIPLHTLRQPWRGEGWPTLGYLVCDERFTFRPLKEGESLPECGG